MKLTFGVDFNSKQCEIVQSDISVMIFTEGGWGLACNCLGNLCSSKLSKTSFYKFIMSDVSCILDFTQSTLIVFL